MIILFSVGNRNITAHQAATIPKKLKPLLFLSSMALSESMLKKEICLHLPGSKSISNRALIMATLCQKASTLHNLLVSDDTDTCRRALDAVFTSKNIDCRDAGTVARFLLPICAALGGEYYFDASKRMRKRPIDQLLIILQQQDVQFEFLETPGEMPFRMHSLGLLGGEIHVDVSDSSQFLSGLFMAAPLARKGMKIQSTRTIAEQPYVLMTLQLMKKFGIDHHYWDDFTIEIPPGVYRATQLTIEPDASTASYFFAAAALTQRSIKVMDLNIHSLQGDLRFLNVLEKIGCNIKKNHDYINVIGPDSLKGMDEINMQGFTDTFMTLAIMAPFLPTPTIIHGLRHTRWQESDRVAAMEEGLNRVGIKTETTEDSFIIYPGTPHAAIIDSHHDHRIAMSFAIMRLKVPDIIIDGSECVSKTCPSFFNLLSKIN